MAFTKLSTPPKLLLRLCCKGKMSRSSSKWYFQPFTCVLFSGIDCLNRSEKCKEKLVFFDLWFNGYFGIF